MIQSIFRKCSVLFTFAVGAFMFSGCAHPLYRSVVKRDITKLKKLLDKGVDPGTKSIYYNLTPPLMVAAEFGYLDIAKLLVERKANLNTVHCGMTALGEAAYRDQPEMVEFLISKGANIDISIRGLEAFQYAPSANQLKTSAAIRLLSEIQERKISPQQTSSNISKEDLAKVVQSAVEEASKSQKYSSEKSFSVSSDVDSPKYKNAERPNDFALVIGIEKYSDMPEAQFAQRDAEAVKQHLLALGYPERNITLLTDQKATRSGLTKNLETWLPNMVKENSTVFFYYSGHGAPDVNTGHAYLVPVDGDPQYLKDTAYPVKQLYEKLNGLKAKRVIVAMDSCFSGTGGRSVLAKGTRPLVTKVDTGNGSVGKVISLSASGGDQISGTIEDQGHGLFTYYFLRGLNGAAKDESGNITVKSLYDYIVPNVQDSAKRNNRDQTPQLMPANSSEQSLLRLR